MTPRRAMHPCAQPGCGELLPAGTARCTRHARTQAVAKRTDPEQVRFYGSKQWKALRAQVRAEEPVCRICGERPSRSVDHIDGNWSNNARTNLRALCGVCEPRRTGAQHRAKAGNPEARRGPPEPPAPRWVIA